MSTTTDLETRVANDFLDAQEAAISVLKRWAIDGRDDESSYDRAIFMRLGWSDRQVDAEFERIKNLLLWKPKRLDEAACQELERKAEALEAENQKSIAELQTKIAELEAIIERKHVEVAKIRQQAHDGRQARQVLRDQAPYHIRHDYERTVKAWNNGELATKVRELSVEVSSIESVLNDLGAWSNSPQVGDKERAIIMHLEAVYPEALVTQTDGRSFVRRIDLSKWSAYQDRLRKKLPAMRQQLAELQAENLQQLERIANEKLDTYLD